MYGKHGKLKSKMWLGDSSVLECCLSCAHKVLVASHGVRVQRTIPAIMSGGVTSVATFLVVKQVPQ